MLVLVLLIVLLLVLVLVLVVVLVLVFILVLILLLVISGEASRNHDFAIVFSHARGFACFSSCCFGET